MRAWLQQSADALGHLLEPPYLQMMGGAFVLLVVVFLVQRWRYNHRPIIPFRSQGGHVEIAPQTLRGILQYAAASVDGVEKAVCRHYPRGRALKVRVSIHLRASARLKDVESGIKRQIRDILNEQFGMERVEPIDIRVVKLIGEPTGGHTRLQVPEQQAESSIVDEPGPDADYEEDSRR